MLSAPYSLLTVVSIRCFLIQTIFRHTLIGMMT